MKNLLLYPFLALLAVLAGLGALQLSGITPFGEATLAWQDNGQQVASDFGYVRGVWEGRHTLDWSYACGGSPRSALHPTFNNLVSPLTWAVAAIPGLSALTGLSLLFLLQLALLPLGAFFYLRKTFPRLPATLGMALALAYAFGGFVLTKFSFLPFLNIAILFPWYVAALDSLLRRGRWLPYCLILSLMLAAGAYFAWMWLLFTAIYAAARTGWRWKSPVRQHTLALFLASAGALLLSAWSWLPSLLTTAHSARAGESHLLWHATRAEVDLGLLASLLGLPLVSALLLGRQQPWRRYGLTLIVLLVGLAFVSATALWHLSRPWDFAGRFGYMADFMLVCLAAQAAQRRRVSWRAALPSAAALASLLLGLVLWLGALQHGPSYQSSADRVKLAEWAAGQVEKPAGRAKARGHAAVENLAFFTPFDSLSHFTACITAEQEETLARWGYQQRTAVISTEGGTLATDTLLGMRHFLSQAGEGAPYRVEENPYHFGVGLMMPEGVFPLSAAATDPIARHQEMLAKLLGAERAGLRSTACVGLPAALPPGCRHYLLHEGRFGYAGHPYERWGGVEMPPGLWELPAGACVEGEPGAVYSLYHLPLASLEALRQYGRELPVSCEYSGHRMLISCRSSEGRSMLFLPLIWQRGYAAVVDGAPVAVQNLEGFVGVSMPAPGEHRVELRYEAPGKELGGLVSAVGLLALGRVWFRTRRRAGGIAPQDGLNGFCRRVLLGVSVVLLLWPLLTLPVGLIWR